MNKLTTQDDGPSIYTEISWKPKYELEFDEWCKAMNTIITIGNSVNWWVGDAILYGERRFGEMYAQAIEVTGWDYQRLANCKWVCSKVPPSVRNEKLKWTYHTYVAHLHPDQQEHWLSLAEIHQWTSRELKQAIKDAEQPNPTLESFKQGWREAMEGDTHSIDTLWDGIDTPDDTTATAKPYSRTQYLINGLDTLTRRIRQERMSQDDIEKVERLFIELGLTNL